MHNRRDVTQKALIAIGEIVRNERQRLRISQEELSERIGAHRNYIGRVERAEVNLSFDSLLHIALALEMKPSELLARATW